MRAWIATFGLIVVLFTSAATAAFDLATLLWIPDWEPRADAGETTAGILALAYFLVTSVAVAGYVFTVVTFLMWLHRASQNAGILYPLGVRTSPAMAVGCWFIPLVNLVRPYRVVRALHSAAFIDGPTPRKDWAARLPAIFPIWWGTWLVNNMLVNVATRQIFSDDPEKVQRALWIQSLAFPLELTAGICLIGIIWSVQERQVEVARLATESQRSSSFVPAG